MKGDKMETVDREYVELYPVKWHELKDPEVKEMLRTRSLDALKQINLYVHIPFCPQICQWCIFNKTLYNATMYNKYITSLLKEIAMFIGHPDFDGRKVTAIYFGGGTASLLEPKDVNTILNDMKANFPISSDVEITMESHPSTLTREKLGAYKDVGINRLSTGIQSFNRDMLRGLGRANTEKINESVLADAKSLGFSNVAMDLMYRLPNQTMDNLLDDLERIRELSPDGVSAYSLVAEDTNFESKMENVQPDQTDSNMFYEIKDRLEDFGFRMVTAYDFAKPGKECKYVVNAWKAPQQLLLGLGSGAQTHYFGGYIGTSVYSIETYIRSVNSGTLPWTLGARLTKEDLMAKYMVLGIRGLEIDKVKFKEIFDVDSDSYFSEPLKELLHRRWVENKKDKYTVTRDALWYTENASKLLYDETNKQEKQPGDRNLAGVLSQRLVNYALRTE